MFPRVYYYYQQFESAAFLRDVFNYWIYLFLFLINFFYFIAFYFILNDGFSPISNTYAD